MNELVEHDRYGKRLETMEKETEFRNMFDNMLEGIQIHDFNWRYTYVNDALVKYSSYTREELLGHTVMEKYPGIEQTYLFEVLQRCMLDRVAEHLETEFTFPDGSKAFFELSIQPVPQGIFILSINLTERKLAEEQLRLAEANYHEIFDNATDGIFVRDLDTGKIIDANQKAFEITGYTKEELLQMEEGIIGTDHPDFTLPKAIGYLQKAAAGEPQLFEWICKKKDGSYSWIEVNIKRATLAGKGRLLSFFREINDRKHHEESIRRLNEELELKVMERTVQLESHIQKLKESEERFQKAFQASAAGMTITRLANGTYLDVNQAFVELTGFTREELIGHSSTELGMVVNIDRREEILQQIREHGFANQFEMSVRHKSGKITEVLSSVETIWLNGEKYAINIIFDITERKRMEEQLKKSDALFSNLFEYNPASLAITRIRDGLMLNVNGSFLQQYGYKDKAEVIGRTGSELNIWADANERDGLMKQLMENKKAVNIEGRVRTKQGEIKWAAVSGIITEVDDQPCLLVVTFDITERKKAEEQLETVNKELEAFTYTVSHDLRAPLRAASGYAQVLIEDYGSKLGKEGRDIAERIKRNASKMGILIDDLLAFSRLGRKELRKREINMNVLTETVRQEFDKSTIHHAQIKINRLHSVQADYTLIEQVMSNLISNAVKYSSKKVEPQVEITSEESENEIIFCIKDNGAGFNMDYKDKLFGVFQRLHTQEEFEGTGVGLAIVQRIIAKHGGNVWAESTLNEGASFHFSLPKA